MRDDSIPVVGGGVMENIKLSTARYKRRRYMVSREGSRV